IAETVAPVLWLSPNEPVLLPLRPEEIDPAKDYPLPRNFITDSAACNGSSTCRIVYWKPSRIAVSCHDARTCKQNVNTLAKTSSQWDQPLSEISKDLPDQLQRVDVEYYFYYPNEVGLGHHVHDFETTLVQVNVCKTDEMVYLQGAKAGGSSHGVGWYI